jgi:1-acyl-sn-glycerol-3-phosphate acyltransferase
MLWGLPARLRPVWFRRVWGVARRRWCTGWTIVGAHHLPGRPCVIVANHASHADTAMLQHSLTALGVRRLAAAGAEDYFFATRTRSLLASVVLGVFPFPRQGRVGIERASLLLGRGWSVLLYPQGTRDGGPCKLGIGLLARTGVPVVPAVLSGTGDMLPKGARWPRPAPVTIEYGAPLRLRAGEPPEAFARRVERALRLEQEKVAA